METHELTEPQAEELIQAFRIARKFFPKLDAEELLNSIELCRDAGCLYLWPHDKPSIVFAGFRYHPGEIIGGKRMFDIVKDWDIVTLNTLDLSSGPIVHVMFFYAKAHCQRVFRQTLAALRAEGASAHRYKKNGQRVFSIRQDVRFKHEA